MTKKGTYKKETYKKEATTFDEQISLLRKKGMTINDVNKAKEYLKDIGYYRIGFYIHPFEITYPKVDKNRRDQVKTGTTIEDIVALYYFDSDLRHILDRYILRIEVAIRTAIVYNLSNKYKSNPQWYVDPSVVNQNFISDFDAKAYNMIKKKPTIKRHHQKYNDSYAPAWKTMEFMTFGNIQTLYENLKLIVDKQNICRDFNEPSETAFNSYMRAIVDLRNACAHGNVIFEIGLKYGVNKGKLNADFSTYANTSFYAAVKAIEFILKSISVNRVKDLKRELESVTRSIYEKVPAMKPIIEKKTGIIVRHKNDMPTYLKKKLKKMHKLK